MPPKIDPYATALHESIDRLLVLIAGLALTVICFNTPHGASPSKHSRAVAVNSATTQGVGR